jgi:hypothetical protein
MRTRTIAVCILSTLLALRLGSPPRAPASVQADAIYQDDANSGDANARGDANPRDANRPGASNLSAETIPLSPNERIVLGDVADRTPGFREAGFYVLLRAVDRLEGLSRRQVEALEEPSYLKMMGHPELYRGQPIAMTLDVAYVARLEPGPGKHFAMVPGWEPDRPIWQLGCGHADSNRPVSVFSLLDPTELLGEPLRVEGREDVRVYEPVRRVTIAGVFFKVYRAPTADGLETGLYPAVIAWQLLAPEVPAPPGGPGLEMLLPLVLVVLVVSYYLLRRRIASVSRGDGSGRRYAPRRGADEVSGGRSEGGSQ